MSRRSGHNGYIEQSGNWYVVRWRMDVEGQDERRYLREKIFEAVGFGFDLPKNPSEKAFVASIAPRFKTEVFQEVAVSA